jgi:DNA invertase Pin-like site-specific DNA recombinase
MREMLTDARLRHFDKLVVWSVDRLARSLPNLVHILLELRDLNVNIFSYKQAIDTSSPMGMMFFQFLGIFAEFENTIRLERQQMGIRKAKEKGIHFGRKPLSDHKRSEIIKMRNSGSSIRSICKFLNVSPNTVSKIINDNRKSI